MEYFLKTEKQRYFQSFFCSKKTILLIFGLNNLAINLERISKNMILSLSKKPDHFPFAIG